MGRSSGRTVDSLDTVTPVSCISSSRTARLGYTLLIACNGTAARIGDSNLACFRAVGKDGAVPEPYPQEFRVAVSNLLKCRRTWLDEFNLLIDPGGLDVNKQAIAKRVKRSALIGGQ